MPVILGWWAAASLSLVMTIIANATSRAHTREGELNFNQIFINI